MAEENSSANTQSDEQYVVLARKYRPQNFDDLVGQDALVQTLTNAIKNNRLHHAYILTGIRGVGKTTTARIIAKALNCIGMDGKSGPSIHPCGICENCKAITEGRHIDVMELDAASHTGVDDVREILDGVRYKPTNARYKIYIIDEVHMLSKSAFNALLKTLEEPPSHVKFIFATTEIRKVPVTILSRCQRFDLQRISIEDLTGLFKKILGHENITADEEALHIIAKAADGSARDGESLLDQAISLGGGKVKADVVKNMIGLADRNQVFELFENLSAGKIDKVITNLAEQYKNGANPTTLLQDLVNITHMLAKARIIPTSVNDISLTENEKTFCTKMTNVASIAVLSKIWQMLIKGIGELQVAPVQIDALEMILIRVAYSASLPTPYELLNDVKKNSSLGASRPFDKAAGAPQNAPIISSAPIASAPAIASENTPVHTSEAMFKTIDELAAYLESSKKMLLSYALKNDVAVHEFGDGFIKMTTSDKIHPDFIMNLRKVLNEATKKDWKIDVLRGILGETLADKERAQNEEDKRSIMEYPLVKAIMAEFRGAKIETATRKGNLEETAEADVENELFFEEEI